MSGVANPKLALRPYLPADATILAAIFRASVEELTGDDYDEEQQEAWASFADDETDFAAKLAERLTLIATLGGSPVGFITLEGGEGSGKTTQATRLAEALRRCGTNVHVTREPGGWPTAELIRKLLVEGEPGRWQPVTETLLHFAARAEHVHHVIRPALAGGAWVVSDRFFDSTRAYQGYGLGVPHAAIDAIQHAAIGGFAPDLTVIQIGRAHV